MKEKFTNDRVLAQWLNGELSEEELKKLISPEDLEAFQKIIDTTDQFLPPSFSSKSAWAKFEQNTKLIEKPTVTNRSLKRPNRRRWIYGIAATILLAVGMFAVINSMTKNELQTVATAVKESQSVTLPDGSTATLNAVSSINYNGQNWQENRIINLKGEAFFTVKKGSKFTIKTDNGKVEVLGTSFNVQARNDNFEVKCYTGQVGVKHIKQNNQIVLTPNNGTVWTGTKMETFTVKKQNKPSWIDGLIQMQQKTLMEIFGEFERQYDVKVQYQKNLKKDKFTVTFPNDDLEIALELICGPQGLTYQLKDDKTVIIK